MTFPSRGFRQIDFTFVFNIVCCKNSSINNKIYLVFAIFRLCIQCQLRSIIICAAVTKHHIVYHYRYIFIFNTGSRNKFQIKQLAAIANYTCIVECKSYKTICVIIYFCYRARMVSQAFRHL